jgi:hypothetical protein
MISSALPKLLQTPADRLNGLFNERERAFLLIGQSLGDAIGEISKVTNAFEALPGLLENDALRWATERISAVGRMTHAIRDAVALENATLLQLIALNREIGERLLCLQRSIRTIAILTANAKIEAARVEHMHSDFSIFTVEIAQLAKRAQETVDGYLGEHRRLFILLGNVQKIQSQFQHKYQGTLVSIPDELDETLKAVDARRARAAASAGDIALRSKRINGAIGTAVMALQISDTTRQRIEHVHAVLEYLRDGLEIEAVEDSTDAWAHSLTAAEQADVAGAVCHLQAMQLIDAASEYEGTVGKIHESLVQLVDECRGVARQGADLYGSKVGDAGSFLEVLKRKLGLSLDLMHDCQSARASVMQAAAIVTTTVRQLQEKLGSVNQIVLDMTLVGMNAALKSRQLGNLGRGLGIIADELRSYANQTAMDADALRPALARVIESAEGFDKMRLSQDEDMATFDAELAEAMTSFHNSSEKLSEALASLAYGARRSGTMLQDSAARVEAQTRAPVQVRQAQLELEIIGTAQPLSNSGTASLHAILESGWALYTMASEREIHDEFVSSMNLDSQRSSIAKNPSATIDAGDVFGDVLWA